jgi:DNA modification methylase
MSEIANRVVEIAACRPSSRNYNQHSPAQIENLRLSIRRFGQVRSVVVQDDGAGGFLTVAGHGVMAAARLERLTELRADVIPADWPEHQVLAYLAADNELARQASPDEAQLAAIIAELADREDDELATLAAGSVDRLEELLDFLTPPPETEDGGDQTAKADAAQEKWQVQFGDLWTLGAHRILCGDATKRDQVARLMGTDLAQLAFTDPPYGVSYENRFKRTSDAPIAGDDLRRDGLIALLQPAFQNLLAFTTGPAAYYIWHATDSRREFEWCLDAVGLQERQYITWVKDHFSMGRSDYQWQCEYCFYAGRAGHTPAFYGGRAQTTIWRLTDLADQNAAIAIADGLLITDGAGSLLAIKTSAPKGRKLRTLRLKEGASLLLQRDHAQGTDAWQVARMPIAEYWHPTEKPPELARRALENHTQPGELVIDLFGGSGSTLIAAEMTGRAARLMELEPRFVSATLERFYLSTGKTPERAALAEEVA